MATSSICQKRGHYYLPVDLPSTATGFSWSILPPAPQKTLYCRRCGKVIPFALTHTTTTTTTHATPYRSTTWGTVTATNWSGLVYLGG